MLVITRSEGQEIVIRVPGRAHPIVIHCCGVKNERTKTGITADRDIKVHRREIDDKIQDQQRAVFAAESPVPETGYKCSGCGYFNPDPIPTVHVLAGRCSMCAPAQAAVSAQFGA